MQQFNKNVIKNINPAWYFVDDMLPMNWSKKNLIPPDDKNKFTIKI